MAAAPLFKAAAGDAHLAISAGIDGMGTATGPRTGAQAGEGGFVHRHAAVAVVHGQNALLAVAKPALRHVERAIFQPDTCAIAIRHANIVEDDAVHHRALPAQDQCRLAFASGPGQHGTAGLGRPVFDPPGLLNGTLGIGARRDLNRATALTDCINRLLQRVKALPGFQHSEGAGSGLGNQCR